MTQQVQLQQIAKRRAAQQASTIGADYSIRYPGDFTALSISPYGRDAVLAGRSGLAVIDLEFPHSPARTIGLESRWKIANVAWCPSTAHHGWVGTAVNQTLLIHDLANNTDKPMLVLKAHPMAITDIAWVPRIPSWIGTASIDPVVKVWDVRRDQKPVWYYSEWEPADLLSFNNVQMHKMASVHRTKIALWDLRFGSSPLLTMDEAHSDNITSISWHPTNENILVSASHDGAVRRWSVDHDRPDEEYSMRFDSEVLGASYLPFGDGLLVTQRTVRNSVAIVRDSPAGAVVHEFVGHAGAVLGTAWRTDHSAGGGPDHQLVTWARDRVLRLWAIDGSVAEAVGAPPDSASVGARRAEKPSFATNYLGPDRILHLAASRRLPDGVLAAAAAAVAEIGGGGGAGGAETRASSTTQLVVSPEALLAPAEALARGRADERSSDDDGDDDYERGAAAAAFGGWDEEVAAIAGVKYRASRTVAVLQTSSSERQCALAAGVPWLTRDTLVVRVTFPLHYPAFPAEYALEAVGAAFGDVSAVRDRLADTAEAYAMRDAASLDQCLHVLLLHLVQAVRLRSPYTQSRHLRMDDIERLPPPPPPLPPLPTQPEQLPLSLPRAHVRRARAVRARATASDTHSDDAMSAEDEDDGGLGADGGAEYGDSEDDDDDDDGAARAARALFGGYGGLGAPGGLDGLSKTLRHANARDRLDSSTPFPRLCGGTFSGAGTLVCFFASIYTPDTYPGDDGAWERNRREMGQQLRALTKPRSLDKLGYYTRMVRFGLEHRGSYLQPDDTTGGGGFAAAASAAAAAVRDEDAPRYYFRPNVGRTTPGLDGASAAAAAGAFFRAAQPYMRPETSSQGSGGGVGNSAVVCRAPEDHTASMSLARQLVVSGPSPAWVCTHNAAAYAMAGESRLAAVWALVASLVSPDQLLSAASSSWSAHPPVLAWLAAVLRRLERRGDAQTLALLACVLAPVLATSAEPSRAESAAPTIGGGGGIERAVDDQKPALPPMLTPPIDPADDTGEIERLMAEGMSSSAGGGGGDASHEATPAASSPASPGAAPSAASAPGSAGASAATASDAPNDNADDADDGNIWRRLRSNVLGRVQPPTKQPPAVVAEAAAASAVAVPEAAATASAASAAAAAADTPVPSARSRPRRPAAAPDAVVGPLATSSAMHGVQASYSRSKRLFERRHTRVAMRRDPGGLASADLRLQTAYLDHWKLVYARVLYRWGMDAKAAEIVSCVADPSLRALLRAMYFQPSLATDDDETGIPPAGDGSTCPPNHGRRRQLHKQQRQLVCAWCAEFVRGRALVCHACGHGGHKDHMLRWFRGARARLSRCGLVESSPSASAPLESDDDAAAGRVLSLSSLHELSGLALHHAFDSASSDSDEDGDAAAAVLAGMMPDGAPTCPAGCGCNCLLASHKLFQ
ncbi:hypothetical protein IWW48_001088 [Coemansia sp. RSA 1200]|nr:hypothetical protein IWW48_001088 [Coemansia sp. RSA 1200]